MIKLDSAFDNYIISIDWNGKPLRYKLNKYHSNQHLQYWHLFTKNRVIDLCWNAREKILTENLLPGQPGLPDDFLQTIANELATL